MPCAEDALDPYIRAKTMGFHDRKHHRGYVDELKKAVEGMPSAKMKLEELIVAAATDRASSGICHSAAQTWNRAFFRQSMTPMGGGEPSGKLLERLKADVGGIEACKKTSAEAANGQFGSGWAWLGVKDGKLEITRTGNADTPIAHGGKSLLAIDVWEHAYDIDDPSKRADDVTAYLEHLVNWDFAAANLG